MRHMGAVFLTLWAAFGALWVLPYVLYQSGLSLHAVGNATTLLSDIAMPWITIAALILTIAGRLHPKRLFLPLAVGYALVWLLWTLMPTMLATNTRVPIRPLAWGYTVLLIALSLAGIFAYRRQHRVADGLG